NQFMHHLQSQKYSVATRFYCYRRGLNIMVETLRKMNEGKSSSTFVGRAICFDIFELIGGHVDSFLREIHASKSQPDNPDSAQIAKLSLEAIHLTIKLDCLTLDVDRDAIQQKKPPGHEIRPQSSGIWKYIIKSIKGGDIDVVTKALGGALGLCQLEKFIPRH